MLQINLLLKLGNTTPILPCSLLMIIITDFIENQFFGKDANVIK